MSDGLVRVVCPLCSGEGERELFHKEGFRIVRCRTCSLVFVNPRLTADMLERLYGEQMISSAPYYMRTARDDTKSFASRLKLIERYRPPGSLFEIGCGPGTFQQVARSRGWTTQGIDLNPQSVECGRAAGLDVRHEALSFASMQGVVADVIVMGDVIEHLTDPRESLRIAARALAPDGVLWVTTPDIGAFMARLLGRHWFHCKPVEHLTYFDRRTIARLLEEEGFEVLRQGSVGRVRSLAVLIDKVSAYSPRLSRLLKLVLPDRLAESLRAPVNPGDEMYVVARKR